MKSKTYGFIRWSSALQSWGESERRQEGSIKTWCVVNGFGEPTKIFKAEAISAKAGKQFESKAWKELQSTLKAGDFLCLEDQDRLDRRDPLMMLVGLKDIVERGITVVFTKDGTKVTKENFFECGTYLTNSLKSTVAFTENKKRKERLAARWAGRREAIAKGEFVPMPGLPFWLSCGEDRFILDQDLAHTVKRVFELYVEGYGCQTIIPMLEKENVKLPTEGRKNGKGWNSTMVQRLLSNKAVIGTYAPKVSKHQVPEVPKYFPRVISDELFYAANAKLKQRQNFTGRKATIPNPFAGLLKCTKCGGNLERHSSRGILYFICSNSAHGKCSHQSIKVEWLEKSFFEAIRAGTHFDKVVSASSPESSSKAILEGKLAVLKDKLEQTQKDYAESPSKFLAGIIYKLETEQTTLEKELEEEITKEKGTLPAKTAYAELKKEILNKDLEKPEFRIRVGELLRDMVEDIQVDTTEKWYGVTIKGEAKTVKGHKVDILAVQNIPQGDKPYTITLMKKLPVAA